MIKAIGIVMLLPIWIIVTILSPIICKTHWVKTYKNLGIYKSFWNTWRRELIGIWIDDFFI